MVDFRQALAKLRGELPEDASGAAAQLDALEQALQPYTDLDPQKARDAIAAQANRAAADAQAQAIVAERDDFKAQLAKAQELATNARKETEAVRGLVSAGVRPEYENLLLPSVLTSMEVKEDGTVTPKEGLWTGLKEKYPAMFHADDAAGTGTTTTESSTTQAAPVPVKNGVISGVDPSTVLQNGVTVA